MPMYNHRVSIAIPKNILKDIDDSSQFNRSYTIRQLIDKAIPIPDKEPVIMPYGVGVISVTVTLTKGQYESIEQFATKHGINRSRAAFSLVAIGLKV